MTMENKKLEIPKKPFADFKWKWASVQCTEGINDPVVLLGVLFRMAKLEGKYKYSSEQFGSELIGLSHDLQGTGVNVDLERRVGERNIIRNSGQYWKALNLIPSKSTRGLRFLKPNFPLSPLSTSSYLTQVSKLKKNVRNGKKQE